MARDWEEDKIWVPIEIEISDLSIPRPAHQSVRMVGSEIEQKLETYWWLIKCIEFISLGEGFQIYVMQVDTISKPKNETDFRLGFGICIPG